MARLRFCVIRFIHLKKSFLLTLGLIYTTSGFSQNSLCPHTSADSASILDVVLRKNMLLKPRGVSMEEVKRTPSYQPIIEVDTNTCIWTVQSRDYYTTRKGKCRHTNGCTVEITKTVWVSGTKKKVIKHKTSKRYLPNYE